MQHQQIILLRKGLLMGFSWQRAERQESIQDEQPLRQYPLYRSVSSSHGWSHFLLMVSRGRSPRPINDPDEGSNCCRDKVPHISLWTEEDACKRTPRTKAELSGSACRVGLRAYNFHSIHASAYSFKPYLAGNSGLQAASGPNLATFTALTKPHTLTLWCMHATK